MKMLVGLLVACLVGSSLAQDCSAKFKQFHECLETAHKQERTDIKTKFETEKPQFDACYTKNGCTPPPVGEAKFSEGGSSSSASAESSGEKHGNFSGEHFRRGNFSHGKFGHRGNFSHHGNFSGNFTEMRECNKAFFQTIKQQTEECIKKAVPGFSPPAKNGSRHFEGKRFGHGHFGGHFDFRGHKKGMENCANKKEVFQCIRELMNSSRPSEEEKKAAFQKRCDSKQQCLTALGADCEAQLEKLKQATCQCRQQQEQEAEKIRSGIPECSGVEQRKPKHEKSQRSCDGEKNYCKLGYDALAQDQKAKFEEFRSHHLNKTKEE